MPRPRAFDEDSATDSAVQTFWARGFSGATPAMLEQEMGIARSSLYNTFGSKAELYQRALERYVRDESEVLIQVLGRDGGALDRLHAAISHVVEHSVEDQDRKGCLITNASIERAQEDENVRSLLRRVIDDQVAAFTAVIDEGRASGEIDPDTDSEATASLLVATLNGIRVLARIDPSPHRLAPLVEAALKGITNGSAAQG